MKKAKFSKYLIHRRLENIPRLSGFAMENGRPDKIVKVLCRSFITSDEVSFYTLIEGLTEVFLLKAAINEPFVNNFLILHHSDLTVDIYVNDLPIAIEFLSKRDIKKGENVFENDIVDVRRLRFIDININKTDHVVFLFKQGWRFGLFFDFTNNGTSQYEIDLNQLYFDLGSYYKKLAYIYLYKTLENSVYFSEMKSDGWFPYIELLGHDYRDLSKAYDNKFIFPDTVNKLLEGFNEERVEKLTSKWWKNPLYLKKRKLLEAGTNSFLRNNEEGFITGIKTLYSEIEGILGYLIFEDKNIHTSQSKELLLHLKEKGKKKAGTKDPLSLPD